jgi:soluble lytic murein transglycosylase-like protein
MHGSCRIALFLLAMAAPPLRAEVFAYVSERGSLVLSNLDGDRQRGTVLVAATVDGQPPGAAQSWYRALPYRDEVEQAAREFGLDASLLHAVIGVESGHSAAAVSAKGAIGLMQLMPPTARRFGVADAYDPLQNIRGGARYLRYLLDLFGGDVELALAAYNAGENAVLRHGRRVPPFRETIEYVRKVRQHRPS